MMAKPQVLFYYPQHFNRSAEGTNPFFDRLLEACDKNGVTYRLYEEPDRATDKPRNSKARKADFFFYLVLIVRKIVGLFSHKDFYHREKYVAWIINLLTFGYYKSPVSVTISGSMLHLFSELNPNGKVYDAQHGVLMKSHRTFFDEGGHLRQQYYKSNLHWLMWGNGYTELFCRGEENLLTNRVHTIGYPINKDTRTILCKEKVALISLQYTYDWDLPFLERQKALLNHTLSELEGSGYKVWIRHHPRYNNVISIDDILEKYDFVTLTTLPFTELLEKVSLHLTYNSTTAFEYAQYGIPTIFMANLDFPQNENMMYREFCYPLFKGMTIKESIIFVQNNEVSDLMIQWYELFYGQFDDKTFVKLLKC